jgi:DNA-binding transcriptional LysR family regulator
MSDINISKIKRLDGSLLLVFRELLRQRRTTVVAERLGLTQSAISHALARLREIFEDQLFVRRPNGLEPTQRALELAPRIDELLRLTDAALDTGQDFDPATTRRNFRIAAGDFMCALIAAPLLRIFESEAPYATFSFRFALGQAALDALHRDEIDTAIGRLSPRSTEFRIDKLYEEEYCIVARKGHPRIDGSIDLTTFLDLGHVIISMSGSMEQLGDNVLKRQGIVRRVVAAVPKFLIACTLVGQTDAIATMQRRLAMRYAHAMNLQVLNPPYASEPFQIDAARRVQSSNDPAIEWLIEKIRASAALEQF